MANMKAQVGQVSPSVHGEGDLDNLQMTKMGQLFTAGWQYKLVAQGLVYSAHIGTLTAGADVGLITGGGAGTTVDSDQPELIVGVDSGFLVPIEVQVMCNVDCDADAEYGEIILFADRTQAPPTTAAGTPGIVTPNNLLDGGPAFSGRCYGGVTTDITDPLMSEFIDGEYFRTSDNGAAASALPERLKLSHIPAYPRILAGPCSLVVCFGGTAAVTGMISVVFAAIPASWFPVS